MKPLDRAEVTAWWELAVSDMRVAQQVSKLTPPAWRHVCFLRQQAGEKAIKAVLEAEGLPVMRTHDIPALVKLLAARHHDAASMLTCAAILAAHAVGPRYPGVAGQATAEDATEALELATELVNWCGSKLGAADDADTLT